VGGVGDEVAPGPRDALEAVQGADGDAAEAYSNRVGKKLRPILLYRSRGQEMGDGHLGRQKPEQVKSVVGRLDPGSR